MRKALGGPLSFFNAGKTLGFFSLVRGSQTFQPTTPKIMVPVTRDPRIHGGGLRIRGTENRPWTLIQTGPPEPAPVYATTANLLMHAQSEFDMMLVWEFDGAQFFGPLFERNFFGELCVK